MHEMTAAIFGLIGVIVGAAIAATERFVTFRRTEQRAFMVARRLVKDDFDRVLLTLDVPEVGSNQFFIDNLLLPSWETHRAALAVGLNDDSWEAVTQAALAVDRLRLIYREVVDEQVPPDGDPDWSEIPETRKVVFEAAKHL